MPATLYLSQFQTTQNLNRPDDNDAMDPTAVFALADTVFQGIEAVMRALQVDTAGTSGVGTNTAGMPWVSLIGLLSGSWSGPLLITYISTTQFSIQGNQTFFYSVGTRIRAFCTAGVLYGTVTASVFAGGITTVTVVMDSGGALDAGIGTTNAGGTPTLLTGGDVQASCLRAGENPIPGNVVTQSKNPLYVTVANGGSGVAFTDQNPSATQISPPLAAYPTGSVFAFNFVQTIPAGGAPTVNLTSSAPSNPLLGAIPLVKTAIDINTPGSASLVALEPGDIGAGQIGLFIYNGTQFQFLGTVNSKGVLVLSNGDSGSTYTATPVPALAQYDQGIIYLFQFTQTNPGPTTSPVEVNISGLGNVAVVKSATAGLQQNDIAADQIVPCIYDGTNFQVLGPLAYAAPAAGPGSTPVGPPIGILNTPATINSGNFATGSLTALNTTPSSLALTAPAAGGPFRLLVSWYCAIDNSLPTHDVQVDFEIADSLGNIWAQGSATIPAGEYGGAQGGGISPGTVYADAAAVTLTLKAVVQRATGSGLPGANVVGGGTSKAGGIQSVISAIFVPAN